MVEMVVCDRGEWGSKESDPEPNIRTGREDRHGFLRDGPLIECRERVDFNCPVCLCPASRIPDIPDMESARNVEKVPFGVLPPTDIISEFSVEAASSAVCADKPSSDAGTSSDMA